VFVLDTNAKGAIAEAEIFAAAVRAGIPVLRPASDHCRYDLAFEIGDRIWRVQCKWGSLDRRRDVVRVRVSGSRHTPNGYVRSLYTEHEIDLLAVYCGELDRSFLLPARQIAGKGSLRIRVSPTRNGQRACTTLGSNFEFPGAVAQLGERAAGSRKVRGSSPLSSTSPPPPEPTAPAIVIGAHELRERFGYWMERAAAGERVTITRHGRPHVAMTAADGAGVGVSRSPPRAPPSGAPAPVRSDGAAMPG
jgi:prevent-host-death family protein